MRRGTSSQERSLQRFLEWHWWFFNATKLTTEKVWNQNYRKLGAIKSYSVEIRSEPYFWKMVLSSGGWMFFFIFFLYSVIFPAWQFLIDLKLTTFLASQTKTILFGPFVLAHIFCSRNYLSSHLSTPWTLHYSEIIFYSNTKLQIESSSISISIAPVSAEDT